MMQAGRDGVETLNRTLKKLWWPMDKISVERIEIVVVNEKFMMKLWALDTNSNSLSIEQWSIEYMFI